MLDVLRLVRFKQAGQAGTDSVEVVEAEESNRGGTDIKSCLRIDRSLAGSRKQAVNCVAGFGVPQASTKAFARTL